MDVDPTAPMHGISRRNAGLVTLRFTNITSWDQVGPVDIPEDWNHVSFDNCSLPDIEPLASLPRKERVTRLSFANCKIGDFSGIGHFPGVVRLGLGGSYLRRIPTGPPLERVEVLAAMGCPLETLEHAARFPALRSLVVDSTPITSFEGLEGCPNIKTISARFCTSLGSLRGLQNARRLEKLDLSMLGIVWGGNIREPGRLTSLHGLGNCARLVEVDARGHRIDSLVGLDGCGALQTINVGHNNIARIDGVEPLRSLHRLFLNNNPLATLEGIEPMRKRLGVLGIDNTPVRSLEPLRDFKTLAYLHARGTAIESIEPLRTCTDLRKLDITNTNVASIEPLKEIYTLTSLDAANCRLTSTWGLPRSDMNHVDVSGNPMPRDEL